MLLLLLLALPMMAQDLDADFAKAIEEINQGRFDRAAVKLSPVQSLIYQKNGGKFPTFDARMRSRMNEMGTTAAVLTTIALLKSQMEAKNFEEAGTQMTLVSMGLARLWSQVPANQKLNYAKQDIEGADVWMKEGLTRKLGYAAVDVGEWETAKKAATEMIVMSEQKDYRGSDPGMLKHSALTFRGLAEFGLSVMAAADKTLVVSMRVRGEMVMRSWGPSFRLAQLILKNGRKQAVDEFLVLVGESVWRESSKAADWRKELAAGKVPNFGGWSGVY